ncbi:MAG: thioredoxin domain-containing protein, partial [Parvibaculum sp.]|nr:thioredoxin domain-containing protein [Parvibaculum sp.]
MSKGDPDAPVTVIEYASLTCNHCADFATNT